MIEKTKTTIKGYQELKEKLYKKQIQSKRHTERNNPSS